MQIEQGEYSSRLVEGIVSECDPHLQLCFLQFLQTEIILEIVQGSTSHQREKYFYRLAIVLVQLRKHVNRVDRSMYYMFYEERQFAMLEEQFIINMAKTQSPLFFLYHNTYQQLISLFLSQAQCVSDTQQLRSMLEEIFFETDYPLPACKRQTIGVYCETPFQHFMATLRFPTVTPPEDFTDLPLEQLRKYLLQDTNMQKLIKLIYENPNQNARKMSLLRFCPHSLQHSANSQDLFIQNFQLHNIIVVLYRLITTNAQCSYVLVKEHQDPIMRMAEFVTRASIYKNIILAIQEKFGFLFQSYEDVFQIATKGVYSQHLPKFRFWNGALAIWIQQFHSLEEQLYKSFNYIMLRQRQANTLQYLTQKSQQFPSVYNPVKLQVQNKSLFEQIKNQTYSTTGLSYEQFFQQNIDSYQILAKDYLENQIDVSINEINVHKIGHSDHVIKRVPFFRHFIDSVIESSNQFYSHLQKLVFKKISDKKMRIGILKDLIKCDLDFVDDKFTKPVILKQILGCAQNLVESAAKKLPQFAVFAQQAMDKFGIHLDFSHKDNLLDYFCTKSQTPNDCHEKLRCFYDSYKEKSVEEMLDLALTKKYDNDMIDSEIEQQCYESSVSNSSMVSCDQQ